MKKALWWLLPLAFSGSLQAAELPSFNATFNVIAFGFNIGEAKQSMKCEASKCEITSIASPPKWAQAFINESAIEKVQLKQTEQQLKWLQYKKFLTRRYKDHTEHKTYTLIRNEKTHQIDYLEGNKHWPEQKQVYDVISLAYGIQYQIINQRPLDNLYFQDDKSQQKLVFSVKNADDEIVLDFNEEVQTKRFEFHNGKIAVKLWLIPELNWFPGQIEIENKAEDRTITLELNKIPKTF